jgi:hypothetical protein
MEETGETLKQAEGLNHGLAFCVKRFVGPYSPLLRQFNVYGPNYEFKGRCFEYSIIRAVIKVLAAHRLRELPPRWKITWGFNPAATEHFGKDSGPY